MLAKSDIESALNAAQARQVALIESLDDARLAVPYHPGINPPLWEGGHAAFFYEVFLLRPWKKIAPMMPGLDQVWDSFDIDHEDRWVPGVVPSRAATLDYMRRVHESVLGCLAERELTPQDAYLYRYAIFHQLMHVESMIWARQTLGYQPVTGIRAGLAREVAWFAKSRQVNARRRAAEEQVAKYAGV